MLIERKDVQYLGPLSITKEKENVTGQTYYHIYREFTPYLIWQTGLNIYQEDIIDGVRFWMISKENRSLSVIIVESDGLVSKKVGLSSNRYIPEMEMEILLDDKIYLLNTKKLTLSIKPLNEASKSGKKSKKVQVSSKVPYTIIKGADEDDG